MEDSRVRELIQESLGESGAVQSAIQSALASSLGEIGCVKMHVQAALAVFLTGPVKDAIQIVKSEFDFNVRADSEYPFRKVLRNATPAQLASAWRTLMVDPDHIQALGESMHESGVATILALSSTHPENQDLQRLKHFAALKNVPRTTWKKLCLP